MILHQLFVLLTVTSGTETKVTDCSRGGDQASPDTTKFLVTPDFPQWTSGQLSCKWTVNTNYGSHVKLTAETFDIPCLGNNGLTIIDTSKNRRIQSVKFCGSKPPPGFVSTEVSFDMILTVDTPQERGVRLKIGYVAKKASDGPKVRDYQPPPWLLAKNMERSPGLSSSFKTPSPGNVKPHHKLNSPPPPPPPATSSSSSSGGGSKFPQVRPHQTWSSTIPQRPRSGSNGGPNSAVRAPQSREPSKNEILIVLAYFGIALFIIGPIGFLVFITFNKGCHEPNDEDESRVLNQRVDEDNIKHTFWKNDSLP